MGKDAQNSIALTDEAKEKFDECVAALAACGFGDDGPPEETTFAQIEEFGHQVGRMVARAVDEQLTSQHANHFQDEKPCPCCQTICSPQEALATREFQTTDGNIPIHEPIYRCSNCKRDFFPSTHRFED